MGRQPNAPARQSMFSRRKTGIDKRRRTGDVYHLTRVHVRFGAGIKGWEDFSNNRVLKVVIPHRPELLTWGLVQASAP